MNVLVNVRERGSSSMRSTCAASTFGSCSLPCAASVFNSSSGMVDQRKYESRDASSYCPMRIDARLLAAVLDLEQEVGPDQHGLQRQLHALFIRIAALRRAIVKGHQRRDIGGLHRAAVRLAQEGAQHLLGGLARLQRLAAGLRAQQAVVQRELLRRWRSEAVC